MVKEDFAIIGTGEVPCGYYPERSEFEIAYTVARMAVKDAGIDMKDVGAVLTGLHIMGSEYNTEMFFGHLTEAIGAKNCKSVATVVSGGGSSFSIRRAAEGILASGETDTVLVVHAQRFSQFTVNEQIKFFAYGRFESGVGNPLRHDLQRSCSHDEPGLHELHGHDSGAGGCSCCGLSEMGQSAAECYVLYQNSHH